MSELYAIEKSTLDGIGSAIKVIKSKSGNMPVANFQREIESVATFTIDDSKVLSSRNFVSEKFHIYRSTLPTNITARSCVVLNNELYLIGYDSDGYGRMYKLNGDSWNQIYCDTYNQVTSGSGLGRTRGQAVIFNNEIYVITHTDYAIKKWNGLEWVLVKTMQDGYRVGGTLVVYNDEIHVLGGTADYSNMLAHYKWDGNALTNVGTLPIMVTDAFTNIAVWNNEIHIIAHPTYYSGLAHYKWNGNTWTRVSTSPMAVGGGMSVIDGDLHIFGYGLGSDGQMYSTGRAHYKWDGSAWTALEDIPCEFYGGAWVVLDGKLHLLGSNGTNKHYSHIIVGVTRYKEVTT